MKENLEKYGLRFSNYGSRGRSGPTIGMALITMVNQQHSDLEIFRLGAMAPMYPFNSANNQPVGIARDHRAYYDIMRRLKIMFNLDIDLTDLIPMADTECHELQEALDRIGSDNPKAKDLIDRARADYVVRPFVEPSNLHPTLDRSLEDIIQNMPDTPTGEI